MKKNIYLISLTVLVSLFLTACTKNASTTKTLDKESGENVVEESQQSEEMEEESLNANIFDLVELGKSVKCTYEDDGDDKNIKTQTYISNGKTRSDIEIEEVDGSITESHVLSDGEWMYTWSIESKQGNKINLKEIKEQSTKIEGQNADYSNQSERVDYKCSPWIADESKFEIPTDVEFINITEMMENLSI